MNGLVIELPTATVSRLERLRRSLGKSRVDALDFALQTAMNTIEAERVFKSVNAKARGYSDEQLMDIATDAVNSYRTKRRQG